MNKTFIQDIDKDKMNTILSQVDEDSKYFTSITDSVMRGYTNDLDVLMGQIKADISNLSIDQIETYVLELSNMLYFIGEKLEFVGIKEDISKAAYKEVYNKAYLENDIEVIASDSGKKTKPTKDANIAVAEEKSKYESVINSIYDRVYKLIKFKVDAGYELLSSLKKVLSRRMQEIDVGRFQPRD